MTRATRLAKAAAWEEAARKLDSHTFCAIDLTLWPLSEVCMVLDAAFRTEQRDIMSLHCLSEAARLRSGVPV